MSKTKLHRVLTPVLGVYADVRAIVQTGMNAG